MKRKKVAITVVFLLMLSAPAIILAQSFDTHIYTKGSPDDFKLSSTCKGCHPLIYDEWMSSMHSKSTYSKDALHKSLKDVYEHSLIEKEQTPGYFCAHCHAPMVKDIGQVISGAKQLEMDDPLEQESVGCMFCHSIESAHDGMPTKYYKLAIDSSMKGPGYTSTKSPAHDRNTNPIFKTEEVCSGCHGYLKNELGVNICSLREEEWDGVKQCQECHMREIDGKPSGLSKDRTVHKSHAASGGHVKEMLQKSATMKLSLEKKSNKIIAHVSATNLTAHKLPSTMPFRMVVLKVTAKDKDGKVVWENFKTDPMKEDPKAVFFKVFGAGDRVGVPTWEAEKIVMDTRIPAGATVKNDYEIPLKGVTNIDAMLLYFVLPGPAIERFNIEKDGYLDVPHPIAMVSASVK